MSRDKYARDARRKIAEILEQTAEVVRLGQFDQAVEAVEFAVDLVKHLRNQMAKPELAVVAGSGEAERDDLAP